MSVKLPEEEALEQALQQAIRVRKLAHLHFARMMNDASYFRNQHEMARVYMESIADEHEYEHRIMETFLGGFANDPGSEST